jgi:hypothetical protein
MALLGVAAVIQMHHLAHKKEVTGLFWARDCGWGGFTILIARRRLWWMRKAD